MPQLVDVLAEVLRSFGYRATVDAEPAPGEPAYQVPLWAEKDARTVAVEFWYESEPPSASFLDGFRDFLDETRADHGILVSFGGAPDVASGDGRLEVWGVERIRMVLGAAVLDETCPGLLDRDDPLSAGGDPAEEIPEDETDALEADGPPSFDMFDAAEAEEETAEPSPAPAPTATPDPGGERPMETPPVRAAAAEAEPSDDDGLFEMLPGRDDEAESPVPEPEGATPDVPEEGQPFEMLPGRDDEAESPVPEPEGEEPPRDAAEEGKPFEMLPGRDDEGETSAPPAEAVHAPEAPQGDEPFEMLPGRADPGDAEPTAPAGAPGAPGGLPGRPQDTRDAPAPAPASSDAAAGTDFELLAGRAAAQGGAEEAPDEASAGGYDELPGRQEAETSEPSPAIPVDAEGRGYEELPGRHEEPPPEESAGSFDATGNEGRDFEVLNASADAGPSDASETAEEDPDANGKFQVPSAFSEAKPSAEPGVLRLAVGRKLAHNLVKDRIRKVREERLRLVPFLVFTYEADILVDGKLDAETKRGRVGVDAWMKRAQVWQHGTQTAPLDAEGADVEQLSVRVNEDEARRIVLGHLEELVGREITEEQEGDDWSVVVKRRVRLAEDDVRIRFDGTYWLPVWRLAGGEGSVEIDAAGGEVLEEEILVEHSDSQLL